MTSSKSITHNKDKSKKILKWLYYVLIAILSWSILDNAFIWAIGDLRHPVKTGYCSTSNDAISYVSPSNRTQDIIYIVLSVVVILLLIGLFKNKSIVYRSIVLLALVAITIYLIISGLSSIGGAIGCLSF